MTSLGFERVDEEASRAIGEALADRVVAQIAAGDSSLGSIHRHMQIIAQENDHRFSAVGAVFLGALADRDTGLDVITDYIDDPDEVWIVDEDRPTVRLALAAAHLRAGDLEKAQATFFEASARSIREFRPGDLPRINDFVAEWVRYSLRQ